MQQNIHKNLADFGKKLVSTKTVASGLPLISDYACRILNAQRCSVFIHDKKNRKLWTVLADGIEQIVINSDHGIVGKSFHSRKILIENNLSDNPYFMEEVDEASGFQTKNLIVAPIFDSSSIALGAIELLNKEGGFTEEDKENIQLFSIFISGFVDAMKHK